VVVRLEKFFPAQLDDDMRERLLEELFQQWMREQLQRSPVTIPGAETLLVKAEPTEQPVNILSLQEGAVSTVDTSVPDTAPTTIAPMGEVGTQTKTPARGAESDPWE
jgi:hypothetical protein